MTYQDKSQLGLSFRPENMGPDNYPVTAVFWDKFRDDFLLGDKAVQLIIEAGFHTIGEFEHNTAEDEQGRLELEIAVLGITELVRTVTERYRT